MRYRVIDQVDDLGSIGSILGGVGSIPRPDAIIDRCAIVEEGREWTDKSAASVRTAIIPQLSLTLQLFPLRPFEHFFESSISPFEHTSNDSPPHDAFAPYDPYARPCDDCTLSPYAYIPPPP